ncbi:putative uncharacterized protein DDB_G0282133 [Condylostylus longicornis]|uniref:putative uncharacterized protein DDB_G0282133 n=1 Tax=Condylostylus longicornis TaxID=2530218 RepID=UPI00244E0E56|nr:putative uncharacterized protein DDB_G0282133 [Condylostylus longicornis]
MSVIIRLQNLPWSANALDIRAFFRGLSIPDGGVHIVGGEMGDAFIAFSTDEDARQAMSLDKGKINEVQVRLLLSSRAEMQKVIEQARQNSLAMQMQRSSNTAVLNKAKLLTETVQNKSQEAKIPQPPIITSNTLTNILSNQSKQQYPGILNNENSSESYKSVNDKVIESRDPRNIPESQSIERSDPRLRNRNRDRYTSHSRSSSRDRDRRRSSSRERSSRKRGYDRSRNRSRERSRERSRDRSRDRDRRSNREKYRRSRSRSRDGSTDRFGRRKQNSREKDLVAKIKETKEIDSKEVNKRDKDNISSKNKNDAKNAKSIEEEVAMILDEDEDEENEVEQPPIPPPNSHKLSTPFGLTNQFFPNLLQGYTTISQNMDQLQQQQKQNSSITSLPQTPFLNNNNVDNAKQQTNFQNTFGYQTQLQTPINTMAQKPLGSILSNSNADSNNIKSSNEAFDENKFKEMMMANENKLLQMGPYGNLLNMPNMPGVTTFPYQNLMNPVVTTPNNLNYRQPAMPFQNPYTMMANLSNQIGGIDNFATNPLLQPSLQMDNQDKALTKTPTNVQNTPSFPGVLTSNISKNLENLNKFNAVANQVKAKIDAQGNLNASRQNESFRDPRQEKRSRWDPTTSDSNKNNQNKNSNYMDLKNNQEGNINNNVNPFSNVNFDNKSNSDRRNDNQLDRTYKQPEIMSPKNDEPIFGMHYGTNTFKSNNNERNARGRFEDKNKDKKVENEVRGKCVKISNLDAGSAQYSQIRRFFNGLYVANNGIKMINNEDGNRTGVAYVRFVRTESKPKALMRNQCYLKDRKLKVESVTDEEFDNQVDSYKPSKRSDDYRNRDDRHQNYKDKDEDDFDKRGGKYKEYDSGNEESDEDDDVKISKDKTDKDSEAILKILDLPLLTTELDIMKMFSSYTILDILLDKDPKNRRQMYCLVKFHRSSEAKSAYENKSLHLLGHRNVIVKWSSEAQFSKLKASLDGSDDNQNTNSENVNTNDNDSKNEKTENTDQNLETNSIHSENVEDESTDKSENAPKFGSFLEKYDTNSNHSNTANIPSLLSLNPIEIPVVDETPIESRRRQNPMQYNNEQNIRSLDFKRFVYLRNCVYKLKQLDYANFFRTINLEPVRIEIIYSNGRPNGDCVIEFDSQLDAERALTKNNQQFCGRSCRIEIINANQAADKIGDDSIRMNPNALLPPSTNLFGSSNLFSENNNNPFNRNSNDFGFNNRMNSDMRNNRSSGMGSFERNGRYDRDRQDGNRDDNNRNRHFGDQDRRSKFDNNGRRSRYDNNNRKGGGNDRTNQDNFSENSKDKDFDDNHFGNKNDEDERNNSVENRPVNNMNIISNSSVDQFGKPDCVLALSNVPYKADTNQILELFSDFDVSPQSVIRRYNDSGQPTGDARIAFVSPEEAKRALNEVRNQKIFNRVIHLNLLSKSF